MGHKLDGSPLHTTSTGVQIGSKFDRDKMPTLDEGDKWVQAALLSPPLATIRPRKRLTLPSGFWWAFYIVAAFAILFGVLMAK